MFKLETQNKLYTFYFAVSVILTIATILYLKFFYFPYHLDIQKRYLHDSEVIQKMYFKDLDNDGETERFELHFLKDIKRNMLLCYNHNDVLMEQFYLDGTVRKEWIHFEDWDEDNNKDILILHVNNDSLYCDVIDIMSRKYLVKNLFVSIKDKRNNSKEWYFNSYPLFDNSKNRKLLYLSVSTEYGIYPRSIFLIDKEELKVIKRLDSTAPIEKAYLTDLDSDSILEYVALTKASGNDFIKQGYHDFDSWLFLLDDSLNFIKEPISYNRYPGHSYLYQLKNTKQFLLYSNEINLPRVHAKLAIFNSKFESEKLITIEEGILHPVVDTSAKRIYTSTREGQLSVYNYDLKLLKSVRINFSEPNFVKKIAVADIDLDNNEELLIFIDGEIRIYNQSLDLLTARRSDYRINELNGEELVAAYKSKLGNVLIIPSQSGVWVYSLDSNFFVSNVIYLTPLILLLYFISLLYSGRFIAYIYGYINIFNYFVKIADQGLMLLTNSGKIKKVNQKLLKILAVEESNYLGKNYNTVFENFHEIVNQIESSLTNAEDSETSLTFRRGDYYFNGKVRVRVFKTLFQYPYAYLIEIIDFSKSLLEDRYKVWSRTSQKIAHDIKTPLSTILLNLKSLQYRIDKEKIVNKDVYNEDLKIIHNELDRIKNLTRNFLKFTNSEMPNLVDVQIKSIIEKSLAQFESYFDGNIELTIDIKDNCTIKADENQLEQLFHILFENAIDAIKGRGFIKITVEEISDLSSGNKCSIEVTDNGTGISKEIINKIFEPYFTTKEDGTGMGLSIGKKIVDDNDGEMEFYSQNNLGTTVKLTFPLRQNDDKS